MFFSLPWSGHSTARLWGDGLVDQSLSTLWYGCDWDRVDDDELVYYLPALHRESALAKLKDRNLGPMRLLRQAMQAQVKRMMAILSAWEPAGTSMGDNRRSLIVERVRSLGFEVTTPSVTDAPAQRICSSNAHLRDDAYSQAEQCIAVLARLVKAMNDASWLYESAKTVPQPPSSSPEGALCCSIYSGLNAGYIYPDLLYLQETFASGAWLAVLLTGRPALLPPFIAHRLLEAIERAPAGGDSSACDRALAEHSTYAADQGRLIRACRKVVRNEVPALVRPRFSRNETLEPMTLPPIGTRL